MNEQWIAMGTYDINVHGQISPGPSRRNVPITDQEQFNAKKASCNFNVS